MVAAVGGAAVGVSFLSGTFEVGGLYLVDEFSILVEEDNLVATRTESEGEGVALARRYLTVNNESFGGNDGTFGNDKLLGLLFVVLQNETSDVYGLFFTVVNLDEVGVVAAGEESTSLMYSLSELVSGVVSSPFDVLSRPGVPLGSTTQVEAPSLSRA